LGQKSLHLLHKVDTSMMWETSLYNSNYKWLSYNLWFTYIYYYKAVTFQLKKPKILFINHNNYNTLLNIYYKKNKLRENTQVRFSYHIELYCVEFVNYLILINIYFLTNLKFFKIKNYNKKNKKIKKFDNFFI